MSVTTLRCVISVVFLTLAGLAALAALTVALTTSPVGGERLPGGMKYGGYIYNGAMYGSTTPAGMAIGGH